jgi:hypothetical protein
VPYFQKALNLYGRHALARKYLADAQSKASGPNDVPLPEPPVQAERSSLPLIGGAAAAIILIVLVGWALFHRRRRAVAPADIPLDPATPATTSDSGDWPSYDDTTADDLTAQGTESQPEVAADAAAEADLVIHQPIRQHEHAGQALDGIRSAALDHTAAGVLQELPGVVVAPPAEPPAPAAQRFCHHCGAPVRPDGRFCPQCGQRQ